VPLGAGPCCPDVGRCHLSGVNIIIIKNMTLGLGPPSGVSIGRLSGVGVDALWDCVSRVCGGGGGCAGGGVPLGAGPCCPDVGRCLLGVNIIIALVELQAKGIVAQMPPLWGRAIGHALGSVLSDL